MNGERGTQTPCRLPAPRQSARTVGDAYAAVWLVTGAAAAAAAAIPVLAPNTPPHPVLHGSLGDAAGILTTNLRVLAAPFVLAAFRWPSAPVTRRIGDLVIGGLIAENAITVGLELGRWQNRLVRYVPHLPLEWLALATAGAAWLSARQGVDPATLVRFATAVLALATIAAASETLLTPHAPNQRVLITSGNRAAIKRPSVPSPDQPAAGVDRLHPHRAPAAARLASRSLRSLPLAPLGSARPPSRRKAGYVNHPDPHRRDHT